MTELQTQYGPPPVLPAELTERLARLFAAHRGVRRAYAATERVLEGGRALGPFKPGVLVEFSGLSGWKRFMRLKLDLEPILRSHFGVYWFAMRNSRTDGIAESGLLLFRRGRP